LDSQCPNTDRQGPNELVSKFEAEISLHTNRPFSQKSLDQRLSSSAKGPSSQRMVGE